MIEYAKDPLRSAVGQEVIESAHRIQYDDAEPEQRDARQRHCIGDRQNGEHDPERKPHRAAHNVRNSVKNLLALRIKGQKTFLLRLL